METLRVLVVSYLVLTLGATGLAKLVNRVPASVGMVREGVFSSRVSLPVILTVAIAEISLAVLLAFGIYPEVVSFVTAGLFAMFAGYRLVVAVKLKAVVCSCAGYVRTDPASPAAVAGAMLACAFVSALASVIPFLGHAAGYPLNIIPVLSLIIPFVIMLTGILSRKVPSPAAKFPSYYMALGTEEFGANPLP